MATPSSPRLDLPPDLPKRTSGLWEIRTEGTLSSGPIRHYEERSQICLNATADQALHGIDLEAKYITIAKEEGNCEAPVYTFDGESLDMTMQCTRKVTDGSTIATTVFTSRTTYLDTNHVITEHKRLDRSPAFMPEELIYRDTMTWIGECDPKAKFGDRIRIDSRMEGNEIQKSMRKDNIFDASRSRQKLMEDSLARHRQILEANSESH